MTIHIPTHLSEATIQKFKKLCHEKYDLIISDQEASKKALSFIQFVALVLKHSIDEHENNQ